MITPRIGLFFAILLTIGACGAPDGEKESRPGASGSGATAGTGRTNESARVVDRSAESAESAWYEAEIAAFERSDRESMPEPGAVLFIGSSSIRMWSTLGSDMAPARVLNRGFGGSKTHEVLEVFDRIVRPYAPSAIVYYCGDNDLGTESRDSRGVADRFIAFERRAHALWPEATVMFIAIKPSIARWSNWAAMREANELVRTHCERTPQTRYLDIATPMLAQSGSPDPTLFAADGLHLNARGYEVWATVVRPSVVEAWTASESRGTRSP